jgi:hypothetical protein
MMAEAYEVVELVIRRQEVYTMQRYASTQTTNAVFTILINPSILDQCSNANGLLIVVLIVLSAPLTARISLDISQASATVVGMHVLNILERDRGNKARRLPCVGALAVKLVDLLEGEALGLIDHSPDEEDADKAASAPDEEDLGTHVGVAWAVVDHVGGGVADGEVEEPGRELVCVS